MGGNMLFWKEKKKSKYFFFEVKTEYIVTDATIVEDMTIADEYTTDNSSKEMREERRQTCK